MCGSMVDVQSATTENRRGTKKIETTAAKYNGMPYWAAITSATTSLLHHPFNDLFSRTTWVSQHMKGKPFWILLEQETMG